MMRLDVLYEESTGIVDQYEFLQVTRKPPSHGKVKAAARHPAPEGEAGLTRASRVSSRGV